MRVRLRLREALEERGTNVYALARAMGDQRKAVTLYRLTSQKHPPRRLDFDTLGAILSGLERLGKPATLGDVLETSPDPQADEEGAWLDAAAADLARDLAELEADEDPAELAAWFEAFDRATAPTT